MEFLKQWRKKCIWMLINKNQTSLKLNNLILQLQCLFNTPANFTFTGKFHTDNTQHLFPVYQIPHLPSQTQPTHATDTHICNPYMTHKLVYGPICQHYPIYQIQSTHTLICVKLNQPTYISDIPTGLWTYIPTLANQHSSQVTKLSRHTYQTKHTDRCWT